MTRYEAWYLVVAGELWLRHTAEPACVWFADFSAAPFAVKEQYGGALPFGSRVQGAVERGSWDLHVVGEHRPFEYIPRVLRSVASTTVIVERPTLRVSGTVVVDGVARELHEAPAQEAHVIGRRHADRWGWFHAALGADSWLDGLVAKAERVPEVAFSVRDGKRRWSRGSADAGAVRVGPYTVTAEPSDFVGVTYHDPDGAEVYCWHTERARLTGGGVEAEGVALEYGSRAKVPGWPISI